MQPVPIAARMAQFLTALRAYPEPQMVVELSQSLTAWLSYYRLLEPVRGGANPSTAALLQRQFVPLALALLDQVADTFCRFFGLTWLRAERSHARLMRAFLALCSEKELQGDTTGLHAIMCDLYARLVASSPTSGAADTPGVAGNVTVMSSAELPEMVARLEEYLVVMLGFFEQNHERSALRRPSSPEAS